MVKTRNGLYLDMEKQLQMSGGPPVCLCGRVPISGSICDGQLLACLSAPRRGLCWVVPNLITLCLIVTLAPAAWPEPRD